MRRSLSNDAEKGCKSGPVPNKDSIPLHLEKMKQLGFFNGVFEIDLGDSAWDWDQFTVEDMCELIKVREEEVNNMLYTFSLKKCLLSLKISYIWIF